MLYFADDAMQVGRKRCVFPAAVSHCCCLVFLFIRFTSINAFHQGFVFLYGKTIRSVVRFFSLELCGEGVRLC